MTNDHVHVCMHVTTDICMYNEHVLLTLSHDPCCSSSGFSVGRLPPVGQLFAKKHNCQCLLEKKRCAGLSTYIILASYFSDTVYFTVILINLLYKCCYNKYFTIAQLCM